MLRFVLFALLIVILVSGGYYILSNRKAYASDEATLANGKTLFTKNCMSCHSLKDDGIGPPLGGITKLLSQKTLADFISHPSKQIASNDQRAMMLHARYKQIMPSFNWMKEEEINSILSYINHQTELHHIEAYKITDTANAGLTGRLVTPVKNSGLKIELEEVVQIPRIKDASPDLGIVTLRPHPSGDGTLFASDQNGVIYSIKNGKAETFLDVRKEIKDFQAGPGIATGVGSFDFHPDFLNNGLIYITYAEKFKGQKSDYAVVSDTLQSVVQWIISEWKMDNVKDKVFRGTHRELLRLHAPSYAHGCQDLSFIPGLNKKDPDYGLLYFGYGDGGSNNIKHPELGHHLKSFLGSVMRIDPAGHNSRNGKYGIPAGNPFANETDPAIVKEVYAYGFRNPHRMAWDVTNKNRMMATDIGESNIEEINIIEKGGDYGWPRREGNYAIATLKDLKKVYQPGDTEHYVYKKPFAVYDHSDGNAISGGYVYEGNLAPLKNKYIFGDIVNGKLFYVNVDPQLKDSAVYQLTIVENGKETNLQKMSHTKRLHLRIAYDQYAKQLYVITKADGKIRRVKKVY
jgi:glucose/arabinose dehydrogenase/mono/diheme cytochrome c family protein